MHHVIFEVLPAPDGREPYLAIAARLRPMMEASGGCLALERFDRDGGSGWMLSMQRWVDEPSLSRWRAHGEHCKAQASGRARVFADYRLRVAKRLAASATRHDDASSSAHPDDDLRAGVAARALGVLEWTGDAPGAALDRAPAGSLRYTAILDPRRHALVTPNGPAQSLAAWLADAGVALHDAGLPHAASLASVDRDYGMFERAEVPAALV